MKSLVQRVTHARVEVDGRIIGQIEHGMLVLVGIEKHDTADAIAWHVQKLTALRIFADDAGKMNRNIQEVGGAFLVVSQFTLAGNCSKGTRPSFDTAMPPEPAKALFNRYVESLEQHSQRPVQTGQFGAMMAVELCNDGPVTFLLENPC